jgi:uncharacterized protein YqeY
MNKSLHETISSDLKAAMKSGDKLRLETLRTLRAGLLEKQIERRGSEAGMSAEDEIGVLLTAAKRRKESIEQFANGGRQDLVDQESKELAIIQEYLPAQMGRDQIAEVIRTVINETGAQSQGDFGKVMPAAMKQLKGKADGKVVQDLVKELLART